MNYVTWSELLQLGTFLITYTTLMYAFFHDKKK